MVQKYLQRISGPLLDHIDLQGSSGGSSEVIRQRVGNCRSAQTGRFKKDKGIHTSSAMTPRLIKKHCELDTEVAHFLKHRMNEMSFSARANYRILRVAHTLADLGGYEKIITDCIVEAVQYRSLDRKLWVMY